MRMVSINAYVKGYGQLPGNEKVPLYTAYQVNDDGTQSVNHFGVEKVPLSELKKHIEQTLFMGPKAVNTVVLSLFDETNLVKGGEIAVCDDKGIVSWGGDLHAMQ